LIHRFPIGKGIQKWNEDKKTMTIKPETSECWKEPQHRLSSICSRRISRVKSKSAGESYSEFDSSERSRLRVSKLQVFLEVSRVSRTQHPSAELAM
jgi:hypothetical protein